MRKLENWRSYAELTSKEEDSSKLMELAEKLRQALDRELPNPAKMRRSCYETASQETT